jgi:hypothetical protein
MSQEKQPLGLLFNSVAYYKPEDIELIINNLNFEQSFYMLTQALEYAHQHSIYTLQESELISKSIRILNSKKNEE